ncbi:DsbA family oxidoreductase [Pectobacterium brasiliense]|uniref:DsbA family oxidoreductase n=1 Tax=Pectobacterium brasiliense TaxID=180957 RepID=UPI00227CD7F4|nr:DsbA family oxidoreductase [Pectobacterium brasiliense]WGL29758.1 DsbA family oxidoreductase [Pectobacterium brasiliense]WJM80415.1 DsbA family oxidoreductase [Pectobacterium brasiliense]
MKELHPTIEIDVWSDLVCPWCWIAKKRFEKGLAAFEHKDKIIVRHHSFRIADNKVPLSYKEALKHKLGGLQQAEIMMSQVAAAGKLEGLNYLFDSMLFGDTEDALTLVAAARRDGLGDEMIERFFQASVEEGRSIFDHKTLIELATEVGMSAEMASAALSDIILRASIATDEKAANAMGANGVPLYVFNNKYAISGAQPTEHFLRALQQVWEENMVELDESSSCSMGSCKI